MNWLKLKYVRTLTCWNYTPAKKARNRTPWRNKFAYLLAVVTLIIYLQHGGVVLSSVRLPVRHFISMKTLIHQTGSTCHIITYPQTYNQENYLANNNNNSCQLLANLERTISSTSGDEKEGAFLFQGVLVFVQQRCLVTWHLASPWRHGLVICTKVCIILIIKLSHEHIYNINIIN